MQDKNDISPGPAEETPLAGESTAEESAVQEPIADETESGHTEADDTEAGDTEAGDTEAVEGSSAAADLPTMVDLDGVADEVQRVEAALPLLDKKNSPMCPACQSAFAGADASARMELLTCSHS